MPSESKLKCQQCSAGLKFYPGKDTVLKCPYCSAETPIPANKTFIEELDYELFCQNHYENSDQSQETLNVKCPGCAVEIQLAPNVTATQCLFCGSSLIATTQSKKALKPQSLLPFKISEKESLTAFRLWLNKRWFAPSALKREAEQQRKLKGLYIPYWTYDCNTTSQYTGERGVHYWVTESYTTTENGQTVTRTRQVQRTNWFPASGTVQNNFDDILVIASRSLPEKYANALEPWDLNQLVVYADDYLSGFQAESYQINPIEAFTTAKTIMDSKIRSTIRHDIGGDEQRIFSVNTEYFDITFKHTLLPLWIAVYQYRKKTFRFLVNARTGEVQGERPYSWIKIVLFILILIGIGLGIAGVISFYQH